MIRVLPVIDSNTMRPGDGGDWHKGTLKDPKNCLRLANQPVAFFILSDGGSMQRWKNAVAVATVLGLAPWACTCLTGCQREP